VTASASGNRSYQDLLADLFARRRFGVRLGLSRTHEVAGRLGWGARGIPVVRVAGTNGKGSTCAFVEAGLRASGLRVGRFSSPHLCRFTERFRIDGNEVGHAAVVRAANEVDACGGSELTFFEYSTCLALALFAEAEVDVAILEVGLGGRLDATRAVPALVAAVTGVSFDHMAVLGDTLEAIAGEKAGTFEAGRPALIGASGEAAGQAPLQTAALDLGAAPVRVITAAECARLSTPLGLRGEHQKANAALALAVLEEVAACGLIARDREAWNDSFATVHLPGRFEVIGSAPPVVIDGAHNSQGASALALAVRDYAGDRRVVTVIGVSADKDAEAIAGPIVEVSDEVLVTSALHGRALPAPALAAQVAGAQVVVPVAAAVERARADAGRDGVVVVCGSLFVAGEARAALTGEPVDVIAATEP